MRTLLQAPWIVWAALVAGPAAWATALMGNYLLVWDACDRSSSLWLHVVRAAMLAAAAGLTAGSWRVSRGEAPREVAHLALLGALLAGVSAFAIAIEWIALFFVGPCA